MTIDAYQIALADGQAEPLDWWHACAARIDQREPDVKAWEALAPEPKLPEARLAGSPLYGVPVGIKDIIDTVDLPTRWDRWLPLLLRVGGRCCSSYTAKRAWRVDYGKDGIH